MKICPICEELIADEVNICKNCGFSFNGIKKVVETPIHKPKKRLDLEIIIETIETIRFYNCLMYRWMK